MVGRTWLHIHFRYLALEQKITLVESLLIGIEATTCSRAERWLDAWNLHRWLVGCKGDVVVDASIPAGSLGPCCRITDALSAQEAA